MKKLIIINGVMGVGKTVISKALYQQLEHTVWLDGDWCWMMHPFVVNEQTKKMVIENITYQLNNFIKQVEFENIIFNWVIDEESIYQEILSKLIGEYNLYKITLMASEETITKRILKDINCGKRDIDNLTRSVERLKKYELLSSIKVDTDDKDCNTIVKEIITIIG